MKRAKRDWSDWTLANHEFAEALEEMCREAADMALDALTFQFAIQCLPYPDGPSRRAVRNPLTIFGVVSENATKPAVRFTLDGILRYAIEDCESDGEYIDELETIAAGLDRLSHRLKRAAERGRTMLSDESCRRASKAARASSPRSSTSS
jgi:hypothetical protein